MRAPQQFLVCDSAAHAEIVDQFICQHLRDKDGNLGSAWSGIYTRTDAAGEVYAVLWDSPGSELFGDPDEEGFTIETETLDAEGNSNWSAFVPPPLDPEASLP